MSLECLLFVFVFVPSVGRSAARPARRRADGGRQLLARTDRCDEPVARRRRRTGSRRGRRRGAGRARAHVFSGPTVTAGGSHRVSRGRVAARLTIAISGRGGRSRNPEREKTEWAVSKPRWGARYHILDTRRVAVSCHAGVWRFWQFERSAKPQSCRIRWQVSVEPDVFARNRPTIM